MGVRTLIGEADGTNHAAAMYDSSSCWMVGPVWEAEDAEDQIEAFLAWVAGNKWYSVREEIFGRTSYKNFLFRSPFMGGNDPRGWTDAGLEKLISYWRRENVGDDGWLLDPKECACGSGHRHQLHDDDVTDAGCSSCSCTTWRPGNPLAAKRAAAGEPVLVP